jgi:hypothetical protein
MKIIHQNGYSKDELLNFRMIVYVIHTLVRSYADLVSLLHRHRSFHILPPNPLATTTLPSRQQPQERNRLCPSIAHGHA